MQQTKKTASVRAGGPHQLQLSARCPIMRVKRAIACRPLFNLPEQQKRTPKTVPNCHFYQVQRASRLDKTPTRPEGVNMHTHKKTAYTYTPFGYRNTCNSRLGFTGCLQDQVSDLYPLGNGHRMYNPILMRFNSSDALSPFAQGGINSYMYCSGDPINRTDHSGRSFFFDMFLAMFKGANRAPARLLRKGIKGALKKQDQIQDSRKRDNSPDPSLLDDKRKLRPEHPRKENIQEYVIIPSITTQVQTKGLQEPASNLPYQLEQADVKAELFKDDNWRLTPPVSEIRSKSS